MGSEFKLELQQCETLPELFCIWKQKQTNDTDTKTFPKNKDGESPSLEYFRESFCRDGVTSLTEKVPVDASLKVHILFILKEANVQDADGNLQPETNDYFWFNESRKYPRTRYRNALEFYINELKEDPNQWFGYMNLNKRGGYGQTNPESLKNYIVEYRDYIRRQIEIMDPDIILCCGCYGNVMTVFEKNTSKKKQSIIVNNREILFYDVYHPAYSRYKECGKKLKPDKNKDVETN